MRKVLTRFLEILLDAITVNAVLVVAFLFRFHWTLPPQNFGAYSELWPFLTLVMLGAFGVCGLYNPRHAHSLAASMDYVFRGASLGVLLNVVAVYAARMKAGAFPTSVFFIWWGLACVALAGWRSARRAVFKSRPRLTLVVGRSAEVGRLLEDLGRDPGDHRVIGVMTDGRAPAGVPAWSLGESVRSVVSKTGADDVLLAFGSGSTEEISRRVFECAGLPVRIKVPADLYQQVLAVRVTEDLNSFPSMEIARAPIGGWSDAVKRGMDLVASLTAIVVLAPLLAVLVALIRASSRGPVFYTQDRMGKDGRLFRIFKFRTMIHDAEAGIGPRLAIAGDERVTAIGRFLRRTRLDELPQLLNVLRGDMSLVGPRPERPYFVDQHTRKSPEYVTRLQVRPGITGLAQVYGRYDTPVWQKLRYDLFYIQNHTVRLDLEILFRTIGVVLYGRGAH